MLLSQLVILIAASRTISAYAYPEASSGYGDIYARDASAEFEDALYAREAEDFDLYARDAEEYDLYAREPEDSDFFARDLDSFELLARQSGDSYGAQAPVYSSGPSYGPAPSSLAANSVSQLQSRTRLELQALLSVSQSVRSLYQQCITMYTAYSMDASVRHYQKVAMKEDRWINALKIAMQGAQD